MMTKFFQNRHALRTKIDELWEQVDNSKVPRDWIERATFLNVLNGMIEKRFFNEPSDDEIQEEL